MLDLSFYAAQPYGALYLKSNMHADTWVWSPKYFLLDVYPESLEHISQLTGADWLPTGPLGDGPYKSAAVQVSQLGQMRLLGTNDASNVWIPRADYDRVSQLPVMLAFADAQSRKEAVYAEETLPPANFGDVGLILGTQGDKLGWIRCPITRLSDESQQLQKNMGEALTRLAAAPYNLERSAWLEQWKEIQAMARQLAGDYWRAYQDSQVERPKPINIWKIQKTGQASALAPLTMVQAGAHAAIHNTDKWRKDHMIYDGPHQGLTVPRYIHTHGKKGESSTEFWMQHPLDAAQTIPNDPELVTQELLRYQAKLDDLNCDLSMLAPVYLLAVQEEEAYISPDQLLKDLEYTPHRNLAGYGNTYEPDEVQRIKDAFENMARFHLKTRQWVQRRRGVKPHLITAEAPYLVITERVYQEPLEESGPRKFLGWKYRIPWLDTFTSGDSDAGKQLGQLLKKSFAYTQKQRWEKRLARYLTIHLNVAAHHGQASINRVIRDVLEQCGLAPTERDRRLPGEYANKFEKAMDLLERDHIIGHWLPTLDRHAKGFPTRDWFDLWLDSSFRVTQAQTALDAGYQKMIDARQSKK